MGQNWFQILVIILAIGLPALGQIWKKLEEKRAETRARQEVERRKREMLRTGRMEDEDAGPAGVPTVAGASPQTSAQASLQAQRQARLQELRRRQQMRLQQAAAQRSAGQGAAGAGTAAAPRAPRAPIPGAPASRRTAPAGHTPASPQRVPSAAQSQAARQQAQSRARTQARADSVARSQSRQSPGTTEPIRRTAISDRRPNAPLSRAEPQPRGTVLGGFAMSSSSALGSGTGFGMGSGMVSSGAYDIRSHAGPKKILGTTMRRADWRRAIVLQEIMGPPVSLRRPDEDA